LRAIGQRRVRHPGKRSHPRIPCSPRSLDLKGPTEFVGDAPDRSAAPIDLLA
jgi:hypothetical protein